MRYEYVTHDAWAWTCIRHLEQFKLVGLDTETTGLDPLNLNTRLRLVQLAVPGITYVFDIDRLGIAKEVLRDFFESDERVFVAHNLKFDLKFLRVFLGVKRFRRGICTFLAGQVLACGLFETSFKLSATVSEYLGVQMDKAEQKSDWSRPDLSPSQIEYAARDASILLDLWPAMSKKLVDEGLTYPAKLEFDAVNAVASIELNGFRLVEDRWRTLCNEIQQEWVTKRRELQLMLAHDDYEQATLFGETSRLINLGSPPQLIKALEYHGIPVPLSDKTGRPTTAKSKMNALALDYPVIEYLRQYRALEKLHSSYGLAWLDYIHPLTGRIHPELHSIGAYTGRMSESNPNLQQVPAEKRWRGCFMADPGRKLVGGDYSQFELRILADLAGDPEFSRAFIEGLDFHQAIADKIGRPRSVARNLNYAISYGGGDLRFALMCTPPISLDEAKATIDSDKRAFPGKHKWLERAGKDAVRLKQAMTRSGRIAKFIYDPNDKGSIALTERKGKNTPIQGTNADVTKRAMKLIDDELQGQDDTIMCHVVHDEIQLEAPEGETQRAEEMLLDLMPQAGREFVRSVPVKVDTHVGYEWSK